MNQFIMITEGMLDHDTDLNNSKPWTDAAAAAVVSVCCVSPLQCGYDEAVMCWTWPLEMVRGWLGCPDIQSGQLGININ